MSDTTEELSMYKNMAKVLGLLLLMPVTMLYSGIVIKLLWGWYVIPLGVMPLTLVHAMGLHLIVNFMCTGTQRTQKGVDYSSEWGLRAFMPGFILLVGWIVHFFV